MKPKVKSPLYCVIAFSFVLCAVVIAPFPAGAVTSDVGTEPIAAASIPADAPRAAETPSSGSDTSGIAGTTLARSLKRDATVFTLRRGAHGFMSLTTGGGFRHVVVMYTGAEGRPVIGCISSDKEAEAIFGPKRPTADPIKEK